MFLTVEKARKLALIGLDRSNNAMLYAVVVVLLLMLFAAHDSAQKWCVMASLVSV